MIKLFHFAFLFIFLVTPASLHAQDTLKENENPLPKSILFTVAIASMAGGQLSDVHAF